MSSSACGKTPCVPARRRLADKFPPQNGLLRLKNKNVPLDTTEVMMTSDSDTPEDFASWLSNTRPSKHDLGDRKTLRGADGLYATPTATICASAECDGVGDGVCDAEVVVERVWVGETDDDAASERVCVRVPVTDGDCDTDLEDDGETERARDDDGESERDSSRVGDDEVETVTERDAKRD